MFITFSQSVFDRFKTRNLTWIRQDVDVLNQTMPIDHEGGAFGHTLHVKEREILVESVVLSSDFFVEVGQEIELVVFLLFELIQREHRIDGDAENSGIQSLVFAQIVSNRAEFLRADIGESQGKEQENHIGLLDQIVQGHLLIGGIVKRKIRGMATYFYACLMRF